MTSLPNELRRRFRHIDRHFMYTASCVKNCPAYRKNRYFECLLKLNFFSWLKLAIASELNLFKNGGLCVRALRCHQGSYVVTNVYKVIYILNKVYVYYVQHILKRKMYIYDVK